MLPVAVGAVAMGLTCALFAFKTLPLIGDVLALGVLAAMLPFGGLHEAPLPDWAVMAVGVLFNGMVWAAGAHLVGRAYRVVRRSKSEVHKRDA